MGRVLIDLVSGSDTLLLAGVSAPAGASDVPAPPEICFSSAAEALGTADVFIDFTSPEAIAEHAAAVTAAGTAWVLGTTGLDASQQELVKHASQSVPVCQAANFSTGVTLMLKLVELAARAVDADTDLEVIEAHHRHKVDAPSGTALAIGRALAAGRACAEGGDIDLDERAVFSREGITGARPPGANGFATVRGGDIVGDHTALFAAEGERLEITHRAGTREAFARGALRAATWLPAQPPGLYDMHDVLKLKS
jgi:4-hydroxy-tetrahydrodipicolinate reductase